MLLFARVTIEKISDESESAMWDVLQEYDAGASSHLKLIFSKLNYKTLRTISNVDIEKLELLEEEVREVIASDSQLADMSMEERLSTFGPMYVKDPKSFRFLSGDRHCINGFVSMAKKF